MRKIRINIANTARFAKVSSFVDKPDIVEEIIKLRKRLGLNRKLIPYKKFEKFFNLKLDYKLSKKGLRG